jgi:hypothetical protein
MADDDLATVLTLLHDSGKRWWTLRAEGEQWSDPERSKEAFLRMTRGRGGVVTMRGTPGPADFDPRWSVWVRQPAQARAEFGGPHGNRFLTISDGRRVCTSHPAGGFRVAPRRDGDEPSLGPMGELVYPRRLLAGLQFEVAGRERALDRDVIVVTGRPSSDSEGHMRPILLGADEIRFAVDVERAVLLWIERRLDGEPFSRTSMTSVAFDEELDADLFAVPDRDDTPPVVPPAPGRPPVPRPAYGPPDGVLGAPVGGTVVVARTPSVVVAVDRLVAYPTGFELGLTVRTSDAPVHGSFDEIHRRSWSGTRAFPSESLEVTVGGDLTLFPMSGSGTQTRFDQRYWVAPLPPPGPLALAVVWPSRGLAETGVDLDGRAIVEAAERAETLWP